MATTAITIKSKATPEKCTTARSNFQTCLRIEREGTHSDGELVHGAYPFVAQFPDAPKVNAFSTLE